MVADKIFVSLKEDGHRLTNTRKAIVSIFSSIKKPLCAKELIEKLQEKDIVVNKTTVYRELYFLLENDIITEVKIVGPKALYELANREHHHHVICDACGDIKDIEISESSVLNQVKKLTNFTITDHSLEFYGLCVRCK